MRGELRPRHTLRLNDEPISSLPFEQRLAPGTHEVTVRDAGGAARERHVIALLAAGEAELVLTAPLRDLRTGATPDVERDDTRAEDSIWTTRRSIGAALAAVGVAAAGTGLLFGVLADADHDEWLASPADSPAANALEESGRDRQLVANALLATAAVTLTAAVVLWLSDGS